MPYEKKYASCDEVKAALVILLSEVPPELLRNPPGPHARNDRERYERAIEDLNRRTSDLCFSFEFEWAWSVGCSLRINTEKDWSAAKTGKLLGSITCELTWSSTGRTLTQAATALDLYGQVLRFAQYIQTVMDEVGPWEIKE
jgi:hypothetical protein